MADCLLAFHALERDEDGLFTEKTRMGALWQAEQDMIQRQLLRALAGAEGE